MSPHRHKRAPDDFLAITISASGWSKLLQSLQRIDGHTLRLLSTFLVSCPLTRADIVNRGYVSEQLLRAIPAISPR